MEFRILGPLEVIADDGTAVEVSSALQRTLLVRLLIEAGQVVASDRLIDDLWGEDLPKDPANSLRYHIWKLRNAIEPGRPRGAAAGVIEARHPGYLIRAEPTDVIAFERLVERARALSVSDPAQARALFAEALDLWRGRPLTDAGYAVFAQPTIRRLDELRLAALQERIACDLALGHSEVAVGELEALVAEHPLREDLWALLMRALEGAGRRSDALRAYQRARTTLGEELGIEPTRALQEIEEDVLLQRRAEPEVVARNGAHPPSYGTSFVGREGEAAALLEQLEQNRVVTVVGAPGVGKTRLAVEVALDFERKHGAEVFFVDLAALSPSEDAANAISEAMGVGTLGLAEGRKSRDPGSTQRTIVERLMRDRALVVLDNAEHVLASVADLLDTWIGRGGRATVLVTSRERLGIGGEQVVELAALPVPDSAAHTTEGLFASPSVQLFLDRVAGISGDVPASAIATVSRIVDRLDGIPLAIELVAARARSLDLSDLERFITEVVARPLRRSDGRRHSSLDHAFALSEEALSAGEQVAMCALSVFRGGFDLDAASAVLGEVDGEPDPLETVVSLREQSLLERSGRSHRGRYRMLEPVREYFTRQDREGVTIERSRLAHGRHFGAIADSLWESRADPAAERDGLRRVVDDEANVRAAIRNAIDDGRRRDAVRMFGALHAHLMDSDPRVWIDLVRLAGEVDDVDEAVTTKDLARFALVWADLEDRLGRPSRAEELTDRAIELARTARDREIETMARIDAAFGSWYHRGALEQGLELEFEALRAMADGPRLVNRIDLTEGWQRLWSWEWDRATACFDAAERRATAISDDRARVDAVIGLGQCLGYQGRLDESAAMHGKALALARRVGFPWDVIHATYQLAEADTRRGDLESGVAGLREALAGFSRLSPMDVWTNTTRASLAKALRSLGRYAEAAQLMDDALSFCVDSDAERIWAHGSWILETSAGLIAEHGDPHAASVIFGAAEACRVATDAEMPVWDLVQYEKDLGILTGRIGEAERAQAWGSGRSMAPEEAAAFARGHLRRLADRG